jgi:hypothetical protein
MKNQNRLIDTINYFTGFCVALLLASLVFSITRVVAAESPISTDRPLFLNGTLLKAPETNACNQSKVKFLIRHYDPISRKQVETRIATSHEPTQRFLARFAGTPAKIVVAGYLQEGDQGPQCTYLDVYYANPEEVLIKTLEERAGREK